MKPIKPTDALFAEVEPAPAPAPLDMTKPTALVYDAGGRPQFTLLQADTVAEANALADARAQEIAVKTGRSVMVWPPHRDVIAMAPMPVKLGF